ncbi:hypothetical protein Ddye_012509 [Dipteronia dyeriana]|uniref:Reverse transcriptase n=1 Tax=Dipteronia dyeriana TaxID=168575 RepID=A0AAD9X4F8_9ROSI|nr:hypothetical protein Ddye_012509 [Dipteronia dyeriana]
MWDNSIIVDLLSYSPGHIDVRIQDEGNRVWRFTGFYGNPVQAQRLNSWTLLRRLSGLYNMPWVVLRDFNEIMCDSGKVGGSNKNWRDMARFREAVDDSNLEDMGFVGAKFTWSNKRDMIAVILERLDRSLCNKDWSDLFPYSVVRHLDFWNSDHRPLVLECADKPTNDNSGRSKLGRVFFFKECWGDDIECKRIIEGIWNPPSAQENCLNDVLGKIKVCGGKLDIWNRNKRNEMRRNIKDKRLALSVANSANNVSWKQIAVLEKKINLALDVEERYWRQRAKSDWLQHGDKNSRFLPEGQGIKSVGSWMTVVNGKSQRRICQESMSKIMDGILPKILNQLSEFLDSKFSGEDIRRVVFEVKPLKAPGKDGLPPFPIKKFGASLVKVLLMLA